MSEELTDEQLAKEQATSGEELGQLMGSEDPAASKARLESDAIAAAEAAIRAAEAALERTRGAEPAAAPAAEPTVSTRKLWILRVVLVVNFALMGVMIALPTPIAVDSAQPAENAEQPAQESPVEPEPPFVEPLRDERLLLPADKKYDEALIAGSDGNYELAAQLMHDYIRAHPNLDPALMQGAYIIMARYLHLSGRSDEAIEYENVARRMVGSSHLPADLWRTARAAEERGDVRGMRQAYARLLLQQNMLTPSQLAVITEAYLKFGESYRLEASQGEADARETENERLRKLREAGQHTETGK
ncbi:MAG: hypothetical protein KDB80_01905 [Planctomycetes bacterium]|nr:hypothetical protein [Planctomycetota bacterium]